MPDLSSPSALSPDPSPDELLLRLNNLTQIGIALSAERTLSRLLERILTEARRITRADAGSLYMIRDDGRLHFELTQNDTLQAQWGGKENPPPPAEWGSLPVDDRSVAGAAVLNQRTIRIADVYDADGFDFTAFRQFDALNGYRSRAMLVVPMLDHEREPVGALQLINPRPRDGSEGAPFSEEDTGFAESLASQAAVAITTTRLIGSLERLFEALVQVIARAVDEKSPCTAGHISRVTALSVALGEAVNAIQEGPLAEIRFSPDELNELRIAGWLHDVGKLTTPEWVINKGNKLEALHDRAETVRERFTAIQALRKSEGLQQQLNALKAGAPPETLLDMEGVLADELARIADDAAFTLACNIPGETLADDHVERLRRIAAQTFQDEDGTIRPYLTEDELENLSLRKGSINARELQLMRDHVTVTMEMLALVPFVKKYRHVPLYAGQHHETLDGKGYPLGLTADALPIPSRILAICDVFDALVSSDRPYKKAFTVEEALGILRKDAAAGKLDAQLVEALISSRAWETSPLTLNGPG